MCFLLAVSFWTDLYPGSIDYEYRSNGRFMSSEDEVRSHAIVFSSAWYRPIGMADRCRGIVSRHG
jgi:hypothetical protein